MMKYEANQVTTAPSEKEVRSKADIKPLLKSVENICANKLDNLEEMDKFLET